MVTTGERKPWHAIFRLLERDERVFAVLLAAAMVGGLATLGLDPLRPRERIDLYSLVVWFALYKVGIFALVTVYPRSTRSIFLGALARGEQAYVFGDGLQARDYVYVGDVAHATTAALGQEGGVFNVGTGRDTSVVDLYALCAKVAGSDARAEHAPARLGELFRSVLDPELVAHELGFRAMVELEDGLQATWDWVQVTRKD